MSFRLFIYYCALCGAWAALVGWLLGQAAANDNAIANGIVRQGLKGMSLGVLVAVGLGVVDAAWTVSLYRIFQVGLRVLLAVAGGAVGGFLGATVGQAVFEFVLAHGGGESSLREMLEGGSLVFGWAITGLLIGASLGTFELLSCIVRPANWRGASRKVRNCVLGGTLGGLLGGGLSLLLHGAWGRVFHDRPTDLLWSPSATGFVALGLCIGLLIGLAQVLFKEAWLKVEAGFRAGREMILSKAETTIGRAEGCDVGLFGDPLVGRLHATIVREGNRYVLTDAGSPGGTLLNGRPITGPTPLQSGDAIRLGNSLLRFGERAH
jgi:hypothetical protein